MIIIYFQKIQLPAKVDRDAFVNVQHELKAGGRERFIVWSQWGCRIRPIHKERIHSLLLRNYRVKTIKAFKKNTWLLLATVQVTKSGGSIIFEGYWLPSPYNCPLHQSNSSWKHHIQLACRVNMSVLQYAAQGHLSTQDFRNGAEGMLLVCNWENSQRVQERDLAELWSLSYETAIHSVNGGVCLVVLKLFPRQLITPTPDMLNPSTHSLSCYNYRQVTHGPQTQPWFATASLLSNVLPLNSSSNPLSTASPGIYSHAQTLMRCLLTDSRSRPSTMFG